MRRVLMVDVDGVLVTGRPNDGGHFATGLETDLGVSQERLQAEFFARHWDEIVTGRAGLVDRLSPVLAEIAPGLPAQRLIDYWFENDSRIEGDVLTAIRHYRAAGLRVFLATNQEHLRARYLMEALGLAADVDGIFYSAALGSRKPSADFFRLAASGAGAAPSDIVFVDDAMVNVEGARREGWQGLHWTGGATFREQVDPLLGI